MTHHIKENLGESLIIPMNTYNIMHAHDDIWFDLLPRHNNFIIKIILYYVQIILDLHVNFFQMGWSMTVFWEIKIALTYEILVIGYYFSNQHKSLGLRLGNFYPDFFDTLKFPLQLLNGSVCRREIFVWSNGKAWTILPTNRSLPILVLPISFQRFVYFSIFSN